MDDFDDLDDLDFGDLDSFDLNEEADNSLSSSDDFDDFGDFGTQNQVQTFDDESDNKKSVIKQSIMIVAIGILIILFTFGIIKLVNSKDNSANKVDNSSISSSTSKPISGNQSQQNQSVPSQTNNATSMDDWIEISEVADITFESEYISSTFTITSISHSVKIVDVEKNLMIKTILTGTLDGIRGTYELELPYSKGSQLSVGNYFDVEFQLGNYNGKQVVGEIRY